MNKKYLEAVERFLNRHYKKVDRKTIDMLTYWDNDTFVIAHVSIIDQNYKFSDDMIPDRKWYEEMTFLTLASEKSFKCGTPIRHDEIQLIVINNDRGFIKHIKGITRED